MKRRAAFVRLTGSALAFLRNVVLEDECVFLCSYKAALIICKQIFVFDKNLDRIFSSVYKRFL